MWARWAFATSWALVVLLVGGLVAADDPPPKSPARGALVVAYQAAARPHAKALARLAYRDPKLRPAIDEGMAQVLVGDAPPSRGSAADGAARRPADTARTDVAAVLRTLSSAEPAVQRRLLTSLGKELGAALVVVVNLSDDAPTARVLRVSEGRFLAVTLAAKPVPPKAPATTPGFDWSDALSILKGLVDGPPPGPRNAPQGGVQDEPTGAAAGEGEGTDDFDLLTSPWFWAGLGVVVTVGVTVFVLSQTVLDDPGVVVLEGRVAE
ncbi:MAG: hypothetical protein JRI68_23110 [Deltaproteobacteria bacterium]|nr:hypothetical protein [Deltaproteobacteria bacterium]